MGEITQPGHHGAHASWWEQIRYGLCLGPAPVASSLPLTPRGRCWRLCVRIDVSEWFCNVKTPERRETLAPEPLRDYPTNISCGSNLHRNICFAGMDGWMRNSGGCPGVCPSLWKHRNVSLMELLLVLCAWICDHGGEGGPLCHRSANCCSPCLLFITKIQTLKMSFSVVLYGTVFTLVMITALLFLLWPSKEGEDFFCLF